MNSEQFKADTTKDNDEKEKQCPFEARFCKYQETYAHDVFSAMKGELLFLCTLDKIEDCPELKRILI